MASIKYKCCCINAGNLVGNYGATIVASTQDNKPLVSPKKINSAGEGQQQSTGLDWQSSCDFKEVCVSIHIRMYIFSTRKISMFSTFVTAL
jgi:hypothetical protein